MSGMSHSGVVTTAVTTCRAAALAAWLFWVQLPLALLSDVASLGRHTSGLASLQTAVGAQRQLADLQKLLVLLLAHFLGLWPGGKTLGQTTAKLAGSQAPAPSPPEQARQAGGSAVIYRFLFTLLQGFKPSSAGPSRLAVVLCELSCSQAEVQALARLILWCAHTSCWSQHRWPDELLNRVCLQGVRAGRDTAVLVRSTR